MHANGQVAERMELRSDDRRSICVQHAPLQFSGAKSLGRWNYRDEMREKDGEEESLGRGRVVLRGRLEVMNGSAQRDDGRKIRRGVCIATGVHGE